MGEDFDRPVNAPHCVLIPVYNNRAGLRLTLESLAAAQGQFDIIIVDDGSEPPIPDPGRWTRPRRSVVLRHDLNRGIVAALNAGVSYALAHGYEYISRLDAGDAAKPQRFVVQFGLLDVRPEVAVVGSAVDFHTEAGGFLFHFAVPPDASFGCAMRVQNRLVHSSVTIRSRAFRELGLYSPDYLASEDYELFLRFGRRYRLCAIEEVLTTCEFSFNGISVAQRPLQHIYRIRAQATHFDARALASYVGLFRSLIVLFVPLWFAVEMKRKCWHGTRLRAELPIQR
jgi:glycosyltransferase involved in cell wall biosynthesis